MLSFNVYALSVASDFLENDTLFLMEGTSKLYGVRLQNPASEQIYLQITYDGGIVKIVDYEETYIVPPKSSKAIFFNISAPKSKPDDNYAVAYTIHQLSGSGSGVPLLLKINKNFNVKIIENPDKPGTSKSDVNKSNISYTYVLSALALLFLVYTLRKNRFKHRKIIKRRH